MASDAVTTDAIDNRQSTIGNWLLVVLALAAALRLALLVCAWNAPVADAWPAALEHAAPPTGVVTPDSKGYVALAVDLHRGQFGSAAREIFRTPGYPAFLLVSFVAGEHWWQAALLLQIAIDVLLVYLTYRLALALFGRNAALLAAIFQATSAIATASSMRILSDGLFAMLLTLAILLFVRFWLRGGRAWLRSRRSCSRRRATSVRSDRFLRRSWPQR